jgi:hypothetical protein
MQMCYGSIGMGWDLTMFKPLGEKIKDLPSDLSKLELVGHSSVSTLDQDLSSIGDNFRGQLSDYYFTNPLNFFQMGFFLIATGTFTAPAGKHIICTNSQDGSQLYLDGKLLVDNGGLHNPKKV